MKKVSSEVRSKCIEDLKSQKEFLKKELLNKLNSGELNYCAYSKILTRLENVCYENTIIINKYNCKDIILKTAKLKNETEEHMKSLEENYKKIFRELVI